MSLKDASVALVAGSEGECLGTAELLRAEGALVTFAHVGANALAVLSTPGFDAAVLDLGSDPGRFAALTAALAGDPRTQQLPVVGLAEPTVTCQDLAVLGPVQALSRRDAPRLVQALTLLVARQRASATAFEHVHSLEERLRSALERLAALRTDAQSLTHDARVLCGVVVGFAANLRDGVAGPLGAMQRGHVAQILEAAGDAAALVERFGGSARAHTDMPADAAKDASSLRRTPRRTLLDLVDLTRTTLRLFERVAEQKEITLAFEAAEPVSLWGDAMQIKQVVTNLLVNALKFTPAAGRVTVIVRSAPPAPGATGPAARHHGELIVRDTGPGIPPSDRERVFERGFRLSRDERIPGTGIGLAVVREIVGGHGGAVRAEPASDEGGAEFVVRLPLDMRSRREASVVLVEEPATARQLLDWLAARRDWAREVVPGEDGPASKALESCRAVVVVPRGSHSALDELLGTARPPPAISGAGAR